MKELTYHRHGDYLIPDLEAPEAPRIGKYGTMRHQYLRNHHRGIFDGMLLKAALPTTAFRTGSFLKLSA